MKSAARYSLLYIVLLLAACRHHSAEPAGPLQIVDAKCDIRDSADVTYIAYACDCPDWVETAAHDSFYIKGYDTVLTMQFDNRKHGYYVEPAGDNDPLDSITRNSARVILYGRIDTGMRYPKNAKFIDPDPPTGKVFIYCAYRVLDRGDDYNHLDTADHD